MSHIGDFGEAQPELDATFGYFGEKIRVNPTMNELDMFDFVESAKDMDDMDPEAIVAVKNYLRGMIHPDDFDRFWLTAKKNRQGMEDLFKLTQKIVEKVADRPTKSPSSSSSGRRKTGRKSKQGSSSRALTLLEGRPDLQEVVVRRQEAQAAG